MTPPHDEGLTPELRTELLRSFRSAIALALGQLIEDHDVAPTGAETHDAKERNS